MKMIFFIVSMHLCQGAIAGDIDILREGCNALSNTQKKAGCLAAASRLNSTAIASSRGVDRAHTQAKRRILALLNDPESAKFRSASISPGSGATCGFVSAKNSMGGYGEPARFIVTDELARIDSPPSSGFDYRWDELCNDI